MQAMDELGAFKFPGEICGRVLHLTLTFYRVKVKTWKGFV